MGAEFIDPGEFTYARFLKQKAQYGEDSGFKATSLPSQMFNFQIDLTERSLRKGRSAIFADCGLGKTLMELAWADNVVRHTKKKVLYITPHGPAPQGVCASLSPAHP